jgi:hypothetical protein
LEKQAIALRNDDTCHIQATKDASHLLMLAMKQYVTLNDVAKIASTP